MIPPCAIVHTVCLELALQTGLSFFSSFYCAYQVPLFCCFLVWTRKHQRCVEPYEQGPVRTLGAFFWSLVSPLLLLRRHVSQVCTHGTALSTWMCVASASHIRRTTHDTGGFCCMAANCLEIYSFISLSNVWIHSYGRRAWYATPHSGARLFSVITAIFASIRVCRVLDLLAWLWPIILQSLIDVGCQYLNVMKSRLIETSAFFS
jgi:hypothetical protein